MICSFDIVYVSSSLLSGAMPHICIDGHVHLHPCFLIEDVLHFGLHNIQAVEQAMQVSQITRFLLLTESAGENAFADLAAQATGQKPPPASFHIETTRESNTLYCTEATGVGIYVVGGRQIVTRERLEVLALGHAAPFLDGAPISEVLSQLAQQSCITVLPWGAGKWLGRRGQVVRQLVEAGTAIPFFLGDNGNRPFFWPLPKLFAAARLRGFRNLPGSDPLPFPGQEKKVGSFGVQLEGIIDPLRPFSSLCALLQNPNTTLTSFGQPERLFPFVKHQIAMQFRKKKSSPGPAAP